MGYYINPTALSAVFTVPCSAVDNSIKIATETQLKVLLYTMRRLSGGIDLQSTASALGISVSDAEDALMFWKQAGIFESTDDKTKDSPVPERTPVKPNLKPTRADIAKRGIEDEQVCFLMREAQQRLGRALKTNESTSLLWLYDDQGMDISVILMLLQYAASIDKLTVSFWEKTAIAWIKKGVESVSDAEETIAESIRQNSAWHIVENAFGIKPRLATPKELERSDLWINDWKLSREILHAAYNSCVDRKSEFNFSYTAKILEDWHKRGLNTLEQIEEDIKNRGSAKKTADKKSGKEKGHTSYRIDAFEKRLNSDD